ncbi:MAG: TldD/PmbA family protein [Ardenticatenaceae bacterium]|nr:TldD/PmbA family protein [Ardenticatenaceae bacterium]
MQDWEHHALDALDLADRRGATYADVRVERRRSERLLVRSGVLERAHTQDDSGYGLRVIVDGAWGFASSYMGGLSIEQVVEQAVQIARASATRQRTPVELAPVSAVRDRYRSHVVRDPFDVPVADRLALLREADSAMRARSAVQATRVALHQIRREQLFSSSEGSIIWQDLYETGEDLVAIAVEGGEFQIRSYTDAAQAGWEFIEGLDLVARAATLADEANALLRAERCPSGEKTIILGSRQMMLQIHESCGHPIELDRVLGTEATMAGTSFLTLDKRGHFRYGSPYVNLTADATLPTGLGSFGYDDEGVAAQRVPIVREGIFFGYLSSRETAAEIGDPASNGAQRAEGWGAIPLIRMTNVNLEPGEWPLEELIADTEDGILMDTPRSHSIDDKRLNFHFVTELGYEIRRGKLGRMLKNCSYTGITPEFWGACDGVADAASWHLWGSGCGKGEPLQGGVHVGHGSSPARFRRVKVEAGA